MRHIANIPWSTFSLVSLCCCILPSTHRSDATGSRQRAGRFSLRHLATHISTSCQLMDEMAAKTATAGSMCAASIWPQHRTNTAVNNASDCFYMFLCSFVCRRSVIFCMFAFFKFLFKNDFIVLLQFLHYHPFWYIACLFTVAQQFVTMFMVFKCDLWPFLAMLTSFFKYRPTYCFFLVFVRLSFYPEL